jgi:hypothetical protein
MTLKKIISCLFPYIILLFVFDIFALVRKLIYLYGTGVAFSIGLFLFIFTILLSIFIYIGADFSKKLFSFSADLYAGIVLPLSILHSIHSGVSVNTLVHITISVVLIIIVIVISAEKGLLDTQ